MSRFPGRLYKARRLLRRASSRAAKAGSPMQSRSPRMPQTCLAPIAAKDPHRRGEHAVALTTLSELLLAHGNPRTALASRTNWSSTVPGVRPRSARRRPDAARQHAATPRQLPASGGRPPQGARPRKVTLVVAGAHNASGNLTKDTGRYDEAARHYGQARDGLETLLGQDHPDLAALFHNLAGLQHAQGNYDAGEPLARRAISLRGTPSPTRARPSSAGDLAVLGALLAGQRRYAEAEAVLPGRSPPGHD